MSHYSDNPKMCRVDFFQQSGKWCATEAIEFYSDLYNDPLIYDAFKKALIHHFKLRVRFRGMQAVCLEPYHKHSHPLSLIIPEEGDFCL